MLIDAPQGLDAEGDGSPGSGKKLEDLPTSEKKSLPEGKPVPPSTVLPPVEELRKYFDDTEGEIAISPENAEKFGELDKKLREKLFPKNGSNKGEGGADGRGNSKTPRDGPDGIGASSTQARTLRWVLRFNTLDGQDYVSQLAALGAVILIPLPPDNKDCLYFPDLKNPNDRRQASDDDLKRLAGQIRFNDNRADSVAGVCQALRINENPRTFWAFFPKSLEEELARKETGHNNLRPKQIVETVFRITVRGGKAEITVERQTRK